MITPNGKHSLFLHLFSGLCLFGSSSDHYYQSVLKVGSVCLEMHLFRNNSKNYFSRALIKLVNDQQDDWDQYLDASLFLAEIQNPNHNKILTKDVGLICKDML